MFCPYCGKKIEDKTIFCSYCGKKVSEKVELAGEEYQQQTDARKKFGKNRKRKSPWKVVLSCLIIGILAFIIFVDLLLNKKEQQSITYDENNIGEVFFYQPEKEHIASDETEIKYADNEILVVASESCGYEDMEKLANDYEAEIVGWIEQTGDYQLKLSQTHTKEELEGIVTSIQQDDRVVSAYLDYVFEVAGNKIESRNGFLFGKKWEKDLQNFNDCKGKSWGFEAVETLAAWDVLENNSSKVNPVRIGLVDVGFDVDHEDLGFAETFYNIENDHGTHVAGTMAAKTDNREGICGVYPYGDGNLYGVSWAGTANYSENGDFTVSSMFLKIAYSELILRNVKIINNSLGFNYYQWNPPLKYDDHPAWDNRVDFLTSNAYILADFLNRLLEKGYDFVLVNSAGNDSDRDNNVIYDSQYNFWTTVINEEEYPEVYNRIIVVGAVDSEYNISNFSNGGNRVDIYAPGEEIYSTIPENKYTNQFYNQSDHKRYAWSGTSMAAPHVSGIAAMVWSLNNNLTGSQVKEIVCKNGSLRCTSCKMVDAYLALETTVHMEDDRIDNVTNSGGILCWVVDIEDENKKIPNALVTATNIDTNKSQSTTTDSSGHFELILPEGEYILNVQADGYENYVWSNSNTNLANPIVVKSNSVNYLDDWIKMKKSAPDINAYQAYAELIKNYEAKYGVAAVHSESEWESYMSGLCFMKLVDFAQDGQEELLLVYEEDQEVAGNIYPLYSYEVWGIENNELRMLETGGLFSTCGNGQFVNLSEVDGKIYLVTGGVESFGFFYYHGFKNDNFEIVKEVIWDVNEDGDCSYSIDGKAVSEETVEAEQKKWFANVIEYNLNKDFGKVLKQNEETKKKLYPYYKKTPNDTLTENESAMFADVFSSFPQTFMLTSGVGAWDTTISIEADGSFDGEFHDSDFDETNVCNFTGKFSDLKKIDKYTYSMQMDSIEYSEKIGDVYFEDGLKYIVSEPYGLGKTGEFMLYLEGRKTSDLSESFLGWFNIVGDVSKTLPVSGIYNVEEECGFFSYTEWKAGETSP